MQPSLYDTHSLPMPCLTERDTQATTVGVLPTSEVLVEASGVHGITYRNIVFEHTTWMRPSSPLGFVDVQAIITTQQ
jgi:hypothetical protein